MKSIETDSVFLKKKGASLEDFQNVNKVCLYTLLVYQTGVPSREGTLAHFYNKF